MVEKVDNSSGAVIVAQGATYGGAASAVTIWGLSLADWAALISMAVAVAGLALQIYLARHALFGSNRRSLS